MGTFRISEAKIVRHLLILTLALIALLGIAFNVAGQTPGASSTPPAVSGVIGEVKAIDTGTKQMIVRADNGVLFTVNLSDKTQYKRMALGQTTLTSATEITVSSRTLMGTPQSVIIPVTDKVMIRRYPPDSIPKYSAARPSKFEELKTGDQLRALGDKSADGTHLTAEEVVFGSFRIAGGTVTAIDAANNQIKINDLQTKKPLTIVLRPESVLRRFPEGGMFGGGPGAGGPGRPNAAGGTPPASGQGKPSPNQPPPTGGGAGQQAGGPRPGGGMNMADLLERLPTISINDLKVGDTVIMSSLQGSDPSQLTAISLVAGVEQLLTMMAARQPAGGQGGRSQGVDLNGSFGGMFGGVGVPYGLVLAPRPEM